MIYQLAKTSVGLGGNLKIDLVVNRDTTGKPIINDIQLSPISDSIRTIDNYRDNESILNHTHLYNLKSFYKSYSSNFYSTGQQYNNYSWIYNEHPVDTMNNDFDMRAHRVRYSKYNEQFAFFTPMWISEQIDFKKLTFKLTISTSEGSYKNTILSTKNIYLSDKIANYLNEYISGISDNLLHLNYKQKIANIYGTDVSTARICSKDVSYIWNALLEREVPLIQNDYKIHELFVKNTIIAQQLFNFDVIFNINDLITQSYINTLYGDTVNYYIDIYYDNKKIELKDIYSNYEFIPKTEKTYNQYHNSHKYSELNVLDYLEDYKESNSIYFNKITQNVFHWSLVSNNDYILNLYNGFSPVINKSDNTIIKSGYYRDSNLLYRTTYNNEENNINWCELYNYFDVTIDNSFLDSLDIHKSYDAIDKKEYTKISIKCPITWIDKHQFENTNKNLSECELSVAIIIVRGFTEGKFGNLYSLIKITDNTYIYLNDYDDTTKDSNKLTIISKNVDEVLAPNLSILIKNASDITPNIKILGEILSKYIMPDTIRFTKTLFPKLSYFNNIEYYRQDENYDVRLYRYFGNFMPCFIDTDDKNLFNYKYYYNTFSDTTTDDYKKYSKYILDKYTPVYPKLVLGTNTDGTDKSFYGLSKNILTSNYTDFKVSGQSIYDTYDGDICYLKDNRMRVLPEKVYFEATYTVDVETIEEKFYNKLISYIWSIEEPTKEPYTDEFNKALQIFNKYYKKYYKLDIEYDYVSETNINEILYKVTFELA